MVVGANIFWQNVWFPVLCSPLYEVPLCLSQSYTHVGPIWMHLTPIKLRRVQLVPAIRSREVTKTPGQSAAQEASLML
eukprot:3064198-Amphidinium_carterae.1